MDCCLCGIRLKKGNHPGNILVGVGSTHRLSFWTVRMLDSMEKLTQSQYFWMIKRFSISNKGKCEKVPQTVVWPCREAEGGLFSTKRKFGDEYTKAVVDVLLDEGNVVHYVFCAPDISDGAATVWKTDRIMQASTTAGIWTLGIFLKFSSSQLRTDDINVDTSGFALQRSCSLCRRVSIPVILAVVRVLLSHLILLVVPSKIRGYSSTPCLIRYRVTVQRSVVWWRNWAPGIVHEQSLLGPFLQSM